MSLQTNPIRKCPALDERAGAHRAHKTRPLDYLTFDERWLVSALEKGGWDRELVLSYAGRLPMPTWRSSWSVRVSDSARYHLWLWEHRSCVAPQ